MVETKLSAENPVISQETNKEEGVVNAEKPIVKFLDLAISSVVSLVFFLCPIFFLGKAAQGIGFEKLMLFYSLVLIGVVAWITKGIIVGELKFKKTPLDLPIIATLIIFTLSTVLSKNPQEVFIGSYGSSVKGSFAAIIFALFYYLVVNNVNVKKIKILFFSLLASSSLVVIYSVLQLLGVFVIPADFTKTINFNPLENTSGLAMFVIAVLPLFIVGSTHFKEIVPGLNDKKVLCKKIFLGLMVFASLFILVLLRGYAFWSGALVGIIIILMFLLAKIVNSNSKSYYVPVIAFVLSVAFLVMGNFNFLPERLNLPFPTEINLSRKMSWEIAKQSVKASPLFGSGPSTFYQSFAKYRGDNFNYSPAWATQFNNAYGSLFEILSDVGILGALGIAIILLTALSLIFLVTSSGDKKDIQPINLALFASFITILISAFSFSLNNSLILFFGLIFCLMAVSSIIGSNEERKELKLSLRAKKEYALAMSAVFLGVCAGIVVLFSFGVKTYMADVYAMQSLREESADKKIEKLIQAVELAPYQDVYYLNIENAYLSLANQEKDQNKRADDIKAAIDFGKKAIEINPNRTNGYQLLATAYEAASQFDREALTLAENSYNKILELDLVNPAPYIRLAAIDLARAETSKEEKDKTNYISEAIKKYDEAIKKKSDFADAYYAKAKAYEKMNNMEEMLAQMKKTVEVAPNNVDYRFELGRLYLNKGLSSATPKIATTTPVVKNGKINAKVATTTPENILNRDEDINIAEQIFLNILSSMPKYGNANFGLATLYKKIGEVDKAKTYVKVLMENLAEGQDKEFIKREFKEMIN